MDYEKKYKEALERARGLLEGMDEGDYFASNEDIENIFPELKESEDEQTRREIRNFIWGYPDKLPERDKWLAWFEKQDEKVTNINGEDYGIDGLYHAIRILERTVGKVTGYQSDDGILEHKAAINAVKELYEKQGENKHTDKVEPKFKVGDWITNGDYIWKIVEVTPLDYILQSQDGDIVDDTISYVDEQFHSFTIEYAKDGDVLYAKGGHFYFKEYVFKFSSFTEDNVISTHFGYDIFHGTFDTKLSRFGREEDFVFVNPATKEQRDLLFQKMKEAGYEWDIEKKELKKIKIKKKGDKNE